MNCIFVVILVVVLCICKVYYLFFVLSVVNGNINSSIFMNSFWVVKVIIWDSISI